MSKYLFAVLVFITSIGCAWQTEPEPYREKLATDVVADLLIDEYEVRYDDVSERCKEHLHNVVYVERGERIYPDRTTALGLDSTAGGECLYTGSTSYIWIDPLLTPMLYNTVLVHELIHALLACQSDPMETGIGDGEGDYNEPDIWCTVGHGYNWDGQDEEDSLEYVVAEMVRYYDGPNSNKPTR
jgi:hypothetical protein